MLKPFLGILREYIPPLEGRFFHDLQRGCFWGRDMWSSLVAPEKSNEVGSWKMRFLSFWGAFKKPIFRGQTQTQTLLVSLINQGCKVATQIGWHLFGCLFAALPLLQTFHQVLKGRNAEVAKPKLAAIVFGDLLMEVINNWYSKRYVCMWIV